MSYSILHVLDHSLPVQSGYAFRTAAILREQRRLGWRTVQVTGPKQGASRAPAETAGGLEYQRTPPAGGWPARLPAGRQLEVVRLLRRRLRVIIARERPDLVQVHSPCLNAYAALGAGPPLVYELRSSWEDAAVSLGTTREGSLRYRLSRAMETWILRRADAVTTICQGLADDVTARGVPAGRVTVIPNGVDAEALAGPAGGTSLRERLGLERALVLGFIGSFMTWEGLPLLVGSMPWILELCPQARLLLVGGGPDEARLRALAARPGLEGRVIFAGQVDHGAVRAHYDALDILVYPRLSMRLTEMVTPLKPLEAMALGKAVIASDVGGHREMIDDGVTGLLFRAGDAGALAGAVQRLAEDPALAASLRAAGPDYVARERSWRASVAGYEPVYRRLKDGRP